MKKGYSLMKVESKCGGSLMSAGITSTFITALAVAVLGYLFWSSVMPVETRWSHAEILTARLMPVFCMLGSAFMIFNREGHKIALLDILVLVWGIYYFLRLYFGNDYPCATQFLKVSSSLILYFALRAVFSNCRVRPSTFIELIMLCGCYEALVGVGQILSGASRNYFHMLTGTFLNPGPYSAYLLVAVVAGQTGKDVIQCEVSRLPVAIRKYATVLYYLLLLLPLLVLPSTWSRAAIMALAIVCLWYYRKSYWRYRKAVWVLCLVAMVMLYFVKRGSADGRVLTWMASLTSLAHNPWLGVGIGGFRHATAEGIAEMYHSCPDNGLLASAGVAEYAFCDILKVVVEQGVVGGLLCLAVAYVALHNLRRWSAPAFYAMGSLMLFSLFSYPFELYPFRVLSITLLAVSATSSSMAEMDGAKRVMALLFGVLATAASVFIACEDKRRSDADQQASLFASMHDVAFVNDFYELLPKESDNSIFLFNFAKTLTSAGRYSESNAMLRQGALTSNDPMFYLLQGNNYRYMHFYDLAEAAYRKAFAVMPNRLYPLYQLLTLYRVTGQQGKARQTAAYILKANAKIKSPATDEIIRKAKEAL